ncbi:MAG: nuclear transport factor 2 family protein [Bacteroidota bacterium]
MNYQKKTILISYLLFVILLFNPLINLAQVESVEEEILKNGERIRAAFSEGDVEKIRLLHHPEVIKALSYDDLKIGRDEVIEGITKTLASYYLEFTENEIDNILIQEDLAIEQTKFSIKGTPKNGGEPFVFKGRTMVTYVRYDKSPTGWATIREIIQPARN